MEWLNYHHLLYFWTVAKEGGVAPAAAKLRLSQPTVSSQIHALERALSEALFERRGRRLVLTDVGRLVYGYADEIFELGGELLDALKGRPTGKPLRLVVGLADAVPKLVARRLLEPAEKLPQPVRLWCREGKPEQLLADLARHELDVVISDAPMPTGVPVKAYSHLLGECGVSFLATPAMARRYKPKFPGSLDGAPLLLPSPGSEGRRALDDWFAEIEVKPVIVGEFEDTALLTEFGQDGRGIFPVSRVIEAAVRRQSRATLVGRADQIRERYYAISIERRLKHPAVVAISAGAGDTLSVGGKGS